jgi:nucleotide-binding universal stress UspA family protein
VLVPYLGRHDDRAALDLARRIATNTGARVTVLSVVTPSSERALLPATGDGANVDVKEVRHASPVDAVLAESSEGYDLVIVGMGGEWGLEHRSFGIRTQAILSKAQTSVLVVRGPVGASAAERAPAAGADRSLASA